MEKIAWIMGNTCIYWNDVVRILAVFGAVCCFLALYLRKENAAAAVLWVPLAVLASVMLARLAHWYFRPEQYENLTAALKDLGQGEYVLMGAFGGCVLAAVFVRLLTLTKDLPQLLDCMSLAGSFGIALGRLASFFDSSDRGMVLPAGGIWAGLITDPVSGSLQWRLNTFLLQAAAAGIIFGVLLVFYLTGQRRKGDTALLFLLFYGAAQVLLDSTRYDALYLRSNGFVSAVQVLSAGAVVLAVLVFSIRLVRAGGWKKWHALLWTMQAGGLALAGYMEYYVQRHGNQAVLAYSIMGAALAFIVLLTLTARHRAGEEEKKHAAWLQEISPEQKEGQL